MIGFQQNVASGTTDIDILGYLGSNDEAASGEGRVTSESRTRPTNLGSTQSTISAPLPLRLECSTFNAARGGTILVLAAAYAFSGCFIPRKLAFRALVTWDD